MSAPSRPPGDFPIGEGEVADHAAAALALRAAFTRLQPQGGDAWNFLAAFTHLGDRYGPYQPGTSELSKLLAASASPSASSPRKRPFLQRPGAGAERADSELAQAMAQVVEAFRFLSARVRTLEERLARQDRPVEGAAWLVPASELGRWVAPVAERIAAATPGGEVLHGDCGEALLLVALHEAGVAARGAEPRGAVALGALERGHSVAISEVGDDLAARLPASLGGLVLSGVVDRLPLQALLSLLAQARHALAPGAPIVIVATEPEAADAQLTVVARDLLQPCLLHERTWEVVLERAGFANVEPVVAFGDDDARFALLASVPR